MDEDVKNVSNFHSILTDNCNTVSGKPKHSIGVSAPNKGNSSSLENKHGIAKYGACVILIANMKHFYIRTSTAVAMAHGNTEIYCQISSGVLQGDMQAPFLFNTQLDYVPSKTLPSSIDGFTVTTPSNSHHHAISIDPSVYADNIAITCDTTDQAKNVLRHLKGIHERLVSGLT